MKKIVILIAIILLAGCAKESIEYNQLGTAADDYVYQIFKYDDNSIGLRTDDKSVKIVDSKLKVIKSLSNSEIGENTRMKASVDGEFEVLFYRNKEIRSYSKELQLKKTIKLQSSEEKGKEGYYSDFYRDRNNNIYIMKTSSNLSPPMENIVKLNSAGEIIFENANVSESFNISNLVIDNDENIYYMKQYETESTKYDIDIEKIDKNGKYLWKQTISSSYDDLIEKIDFDSEGNLICFTRTRYSGDMDFLKNIPIILKVDKNTGKIISKIEFNDLRNDYFGCYKGADDSIYIMTINEMKIGDKKEYYNLYFYKYDKNGKLIKHTVIAEKSKYKIHSQPLLYVDSVRNIYCTFEIEGKYKNGKYNGGTDFVIIKIKDNN